MDILGHALVVIAFFGLFVALGMLTWAIDALVWRYTHRSRRGG